MDFLFGASPIQKKVNDATDEMLLNPDWGMNTEICELANRNTECAEEVVKAVKKRINHRNPDVACKALTLLDSLVKNGKNIVHMNVARQDFVNELQKVAKRTDYAPRDQALALIMSWAESFKNKGQQYSTFWNAYMSLQSQGVDFPVPEKDAPVFTPQRSVEKPKKAAAASSSSSSTSSKLTATPTSDPSAKGAASESLAEVTEEYMTKVKKDLEIVVNFLVLSREMLLAKVEPAAGTKKDSTLRVLMRNMKEIQTRFLYLMVEVAHEGLVDLILELNELVFLTIEWYRALRDGKEVNATPEFDEAKLIKEINEVENRKSADVPSSEETKESKEREDVDADDEFASIAKRADGDDDAGSNGNDDTNLIDLDFEDDDAAMSHKRSSSIDELLNFDVSVDTKESDDTPEASSDGKDSAATLPSSVADLDDQLIDFNVEDDGTDAAATKG